MDKKQLESFAASGFDRFRNPFIKHRLLDISMNSVSKFSARCKGTLIDADRLGIECSVLPFSLAALICFYNGTYDNGVYYGSRGETPEKYEIRDGAEVLRFMAEAWQDEKTAVKVLSNTGFWNTDLRKVNGLVKKVSDYISSIRQNGMRSAVEIMLDERNK